MATNTDTALGPAGEEAIKPAAKAKYVSVTEAEWNDAVRSHFERERAARIHRILEERQLLQEALGTAF